MKNSIIRANQAKSGTVVSFRNYLCHSDVIEFRYSNIDTSANYWAAGTQFAKRQVIWAAGNISEAPLFNDAEKCLQIQNH